MALKYRVAHMFGHDGRLYTNEPEDLAAVKSLPRSVRDEHIAAGHLIEWDDREGENPPPDAIPAPADTSKRKG